MTRSRSTTLAALLGSASVGSLLAAALLLAPATATALTGSVDITVDAACVTTCVTDLHTCLSAAHQTFTDCSVENGCVELAASARLACMADKTASVCIEARAQYTDCIKPCRAELRSDIGVCQNASLTCLHEDCNLTDLPEQCRRVSVSATSTQ